MHMSSIYLLYIASILYRRVAVSLELVVKLVRTSSVGVDLQVEQRYHFISFVYKYTHKSPPFLEVCSTAPHF
jgi:hypothetical protein